MPQITVEYSRNLETRADVRVLIDAVHEAARATGLFDLGNGIRTRAAPRDVYRVADGDPANAFVAVILRIAEGRSVEQRTRLADDVDCRIVLVDGLQRAGVNEIERNRPVDVSLLFPLCSHAHRHLVLS